MFDENKWTETDGMEKEKKIDTAAQNGSAEQPSEQNSGMSVQNSGSADQSGLEQISGAGSGIRGTGSDSTGQGVTDCGQTYGNAGQNQGYGSTGQGQPDQSRNYGSQAQGQSAQHPNYGHAGQGYANPGYGSYQGQGYGQSVQGQTLQGYSQPGQTNAPYSQNQQAGQGYGWPQYTQDPRSRMRYPEQGMYDYYGRSNSGSSDNQEAAQKSGKGAGVDKTKKRSFVKTTATVTAAALLFGVVSGTTMFGVNRAAGIMFPQAEPAATEAEASTGSAPTVSSSPASGEAAPGVAMMDVSGIVASAMPSVVAITNTMLYQSNTWFGQSQTYKIPSSGSGIIVGQNEAELLVATNHHVIDNANSLAVTFIDNTSVQAAVKGTDSESDLAVIAVPLDQIPAETREQIKVATLGDSNSLKMGQGVVAIGNALGHGQSVTVGYVSALDREITVDNVTKKVIQTDAAINPGNSGGALLNAAGEVIGINEAKYADSNVEGIGYAIPVSQVKDVIDDLMNRTTKIKVEESERGYLGIQLQNIDSMTASLYGMPEGVFVYKIMEDSGAAGSDLREKDIITKLDGERITSYADLSRLLTYYKAGDTVTLTVQSLENGEYVEREVQVTLGEQAQEAEDGKNGQ